MFKKILTVLTFTAVLASCGSSSDNTSNAAEPSTEIVETTAAATTEAAIETEASTAPAATTQEQTEVPETSEITETQPLTSEPVEITDVPDEETETETLPEDYEMDDDELLYIAQQLYDTSCEMYWNFHVGCPYNLDHESFTENQYGWQYYLIIDEGINSLADVERDYHTIFSDIYPNELNELFIESDGRVYALDGGRGANIYYDHSEVNKIVSKTENEIFFTVEVFYKGDDYTGTGPYSVEQDFSVVINEDGNWFTGLFTLPY